jgi:hypothetical protein
MELINYLEPPDIPEGLTVREWRSARLAANGGERITLGRRLRRMRRRRARPPVRSGDWSDDA